MEGEYQHASIILAPFEAVSTLLKRCDSIALWAPRIVSCCLIENGVDADKVGCTRRCVIRPEEPYRILRETVTARSFSEAKAYVTYQLTEAVVRSSTGEPFPKLSCVPASDMVTTVTVAPLAGTDGMKCFLEIYTTYTVASTSDGATMQHFLKRQWVSPLLQALSDYALNFNPPIVQSTVDVLHRRQYELHENTLVGVLSYVPASLPAEIGAGVERLFDSWHALCREVSDSNAIANALREELQAQRLIGDQATAKVTELEQENTHMRAEILFLRHGHVPSTSVVAEPAVVTQAPPAAEVEAPPLPVEQQQPAEEPATQEEEVPPPPPPRSSHQQMKAQAVSRASAAAGVDHDVLWARFTKLDKEGRGHLTAQHVATLLASVDSRTDLDIMRAVEQRRRVREQARAAGDTTPRRLAKDAPLPSNRAEYFDEQARLWTSKHCQDRSGAVVTFDEFTILACQIARM